MRLSPRLERIHSLLKPNMPVADIGTDHGYLPITIIESGITNKVIASDINANPLRRAQENVQKAGILEGIDFRVGSGLEVLNADEVDQVIIAGMGGEEISKILNDSFETAQSMKQLLLQPMTRTGILRNYLSENDFKIVGEYIVRERDHPKFYSILKVIPGEMEPLSDEETEFGKVDLIELNQDYKDYLANQISLLEDRLEMMSRSDNKETLKRCTLFKRRLNFLKETYESIKDS